MLRRRTPPGRRLTNPAENGTVTVTVAIDVASTVRVTPTTGASSISSNSGGANASGTRSTPVATAAASSILAFTGADIAATTIGGLLALLLGLFLVLVSRRRRSQATGDAAP